MASHIRQQLRDAVKTAVTNLSTTGSRVTAYRFYPTKVTSPELSIHTPEETARAETVHSPALVGRTVDVRVTGFVKSGSNVESTLDDIAKEVETALAAGVTISGKTIALLYTGCAIEFGAEEKPVGSIELRYTADLFNTANTPDALS